MNKPEIYQLFVYGSLRSGFHSPAYDYVSNYFTLLGEAKVKGKLYDMGEYPAAVPSTESFINGELYQINNEKEFDWAIGQLDDYEGVSATADEVQLYRREIVEVYLDDQVSHAWIYWYNGNVEGKPIIASGDLMQYLQQKNNAE